MSLLNLNLDRFQEEPLEMPAIVHGPEERAKEDMFAPSEASEVSQYLASRLTDMQTAVANRLCKTIHRVDLQYGVGVSGTFTWQASVVWGKPGDFKAELGTAASLDNAVSAMLAKLPAPVDLASILGYDEVRAADPVGVSMIQTAAE